MFVENNNIEIGQLRRFKAAGHDKYIYYIVTCYTSKHEGVWVLRKTTQDSRMYRDKYNYATVMRDTCLVTK